MKLLIIFLNLVFGFSSTVYNKTDYVVTSLFARLGEDQFPYKDTYLRLYLNNLSIQQIEPNSLNFPVIEEIYLIHNLLTSIEDNVFTNLKSLKILSLKHNKISSISGAAFDNLPNLHLLDLSHNQLSRINKNLFFNTPNLSKLLMNNNQIKRVQKKAFKHLNTDIETVVDLSYNKINFLASRAFLNFKNLGKINLSANNIEDVPSDLFGNRNSGNFELMLEANRIQMISQDSFGVFLNCKMVSLAGNPLKCSFWKNIERFVERHRPDTFIIFDGHCLD